MKNKAKEVKYAARQEIGMPKPTVQHKDKKRYTRKRKHKNSVQD